MSKFPDESPASGDRASGRGDVGPIGDDPHRGAVFNRLLGAMNPGDLARFASQLERVTLASGEVLAEPGQRLTHVYFPNTAVFSIIARMVDGAGVEVGTIGNEGLVGIAALLDTEASANQMLAQIPGTAFRLSAAVLVAAVEVRPVLRQLLHRYMNAYLTQVAQGAACNRLHGIEARCARWLLMTHDRVGGADRFPLTQEFLAIMLGVRRAGVSVAAGALQHAGLIHYHRGGIRVLDRPGLERVACECYGIIRRQFDRLLP